MNTYRVTVRAVVTKTYTVNAASEDEASVAASEMFTVECDDTDEDYDQQILDIERTTK